MLHLLYSRLNLEFDLFIVDQKNVRCIINAAFITTNFWCMKWIDENAPLPKSSFFKLLF